MTIEHDLREVLAVQAARAPEPERVLAGLGPARRRDRRRRRLAAGIAVAVLVAGGATAYKVTHPAEPAPLKGPTRTVTFDYGPSRLPSGYVELSRGVDESDAGAHGQTRTWGYGGWQEANGASTKKVTVSVYGRWTGPGHSGVDLWRQMAENGSPADNKQITINGHPAVEFKDVDHYCGITWLEPPDRILQVGVESTAGDCATATVVAASVTRVTGVTATFPLRVARGTPGWVGGSSKVLRDEQGCLTLMEGSGSAEVSIELRNGGLEKGGTSFRLDGRRARYYGAVLDWSRQPLYLNGPGIEVAVGNGRTLIVVARPEAKAGTPQTPATIRQGLIRIARGVSAGPLPGCGWG